jgi:hypothetical protein
MLLSATMMTATSCTVGSSGTCVGAGDCRPGYICRDGSCVAASGTDPRQRANDAGYKACAAAGGVFRIQYHSIDEIDCLIDTFPVWDNPPTVGVVHQGNGWRVRPFMSLTVEATITIVVPDNFDAGELVCYKVWHRSQAGELWESVDSTYIDGEFVAAINVTGEFMLGRDVDALPDVLVWDSGDVALIDTGMMDMGNGSDSGVYDGPGLPDYGYIDGGIPDYGARLDVGNMDGGLPDIAINDLWAPDAGNMDLGPLPDVGNQGPPEGGLPDMGFPDADPPADIGPARDYGWFNEDAGPRPDLGWWGTGCADARDCPDGAQPPPQLDAQVIGDTLPPGYDGPIPDAGPIPDMGTYDGPLIDLGAYPDVTPPVVDTGPRVFLGTDCTEFRNNPQACALGGGVCLQGTDNPNRWYCTLSCVTQNQATCTNALAGSCCVADGQGIQGHCRIPADCP